MKTEILFHNTDGAVQIWFMEGNKIVSRQDVVGEKNDHMVIGPPWSIVGLGDFNQNGKADILFHNTNGAAQIWNMDGNRIVSRPNIVAEDGSNLHVGLPWSIVGVGDFNQNGKADILWHNTDGQTQIWFMDGNKIVSRANIVGEDGKSMVIGPPWSIVGVGDFNQNGKADILFHNADDGASQIWLMDGNKIVSRPNVVAENGSALRVGPPWSIVGVGDFNQNGKADILWHNAQDGTAQIWFMDGNRIASRADIVGEKNEHMFIKPPWSIVGVGLFSDDIVLPPHVGGDTATFDSGPVTSGLPLGGSVHLVMRRNGDFTFSSHAHDSGFDNIDYVISAVLITASGIAFTFQHAGHVEGTSAGLPFGTPNRNDDSTTTGENPMISREFDGIFAGAKLLVSLDGKDKLVGGIQGMLGDLLSQAAEAVGKAAVAAAVALVV